MPTRRDPGHHRPEPRESDSQSTHPPQVVENNIRALIAHRQQMERGKSFEEWLADRITSFTGSMLFVYLHVALFGLWGVINLGWVPFLPPFDPTFVILAMVASVEAIFLTTFILISQNRMTALAENRAELDLQISLLAEREITWLIRLTRAMADRMGIDEARTPELDELARHVAPEKVLDQMAAEKPTRDS